MGLVIAIDGPAGSGKSTIAKAVAARLGIGYLDTGAMYRAVAWAVLDKGVDPDDAEAVAAVAAAARIDVGEQVLVDGVDATTTIRGPRVTAAVSAVASHPQVRTEMVRRQREWMEAAGPAGAVVEGRDIGSVVFPDAEVKVFLTASEAERAGRRALQDDDPDAAAVADALARRDGLDSARSASPLLVADNAVVIDTTGAPIDEVVGRVLALL